MNKFQKLKIFKKFKTNNSSSDLAANALNKYL
jgi:hypothetical protein